MHGFNTGTRQRVQRNNLRPLGQQPKKWNCYSTTEVEELWQLIVKIHERDQSIAIQQVLSAGPIENLLSKFGDLYIDRVEEKARKDPSFAKLLGGVWQHTMTDEIWLRLQAVWDRRGWDGIPE
jgi:hypothetical protein